MGLWKMSNGIRNQRKRIDNVLGITDVVETSTSKVTLPGSKFKKE